MPVRRVVREVVVDGSERFDVARREVASASIGWARDARHFDLSLSMNLANIIEEIDRIDKVN